MSYSAIGIKDMLLIIRFCVIALLSSTLWTGEVVAQDTRTEDQRIFAAIVDVFSDSGQDTIVVDTKILQDRPDLLMPDFVTDSLLSSGRSEILSELGMPELLPGHGCQLGGRGMPAWGEDPGGTLRQGGIPIVPHPCLLVGRARVGGPYYPPGDVDRRMEGPSSNWTVRVMRTGDGRHAVYDVVLTHRCNDGWEVIETVLLDVIVS
jgi:hypothetical protein